MRDLAGRDGGSGRGLAVAGWLVLAAAGTVGVWRLAAYVESLTALAQTDRAAAATLFKSRALPAVGAIALISAIAGVMLARHGLVALRAGRLPQDDGAGVDEEEPERRSARLVGTLFVTSGILTALLPLTVLALMLWAVR